MNLRFLNRPVSNSSTNGSFSSFLDFTTIKFTTLFKFLDLPGSRDSTTTCPYQKLKCFYFLPYIYSYLQGPSLYLIPTPLRNKQIQTPMSQTSLFYIPSVYILQPLNKILPCFWVNMVKVRGLYSWMKWTKSVKDFGPSS